MKRAVAEANLHIDEHAEVRELKTQLAEARAEFEAAQAEASALERILSPLPDTNEPAPNVTELDALRARQQLPFAQERLLLAKATLLELKPRFEKARHEVLQAFTAERNKARLLILQRFADALESARDVSDELLVFDQETVRLGGARETHPFPQLSDEKPFRWGYASAVRNEVIRLEQN